MCFHASSIFSFHSLTKTSYAAKIPLTIQLLEGKKKKKTKGNKTKQSKKNKQTNSHLPKIILQLPLLVQIYPPHQYKGQVPHHGTEVKVWKLKFLFEVSNNLRFYGRH